MKSDSSFEKHRQIQLLTKEVLEKLSRLIHPDSTEQTIASLAQQLLAEQGLTETWYHRCMALVLLGSRSCLSESGATYFPTNEPVGDLNLVTVDLSPTLGRVWGDCARSFFVENGKVTIEPTFAEFRRGQAVQQRLHRELLARTTPTTSLAAASAMSTEILEEEGFENLDFLGNVGHTIADTLDKRRWVQPGENATVGDVGLFTFEPHIRMEGGRWGFKHEDIYFMASDGQLNVL